MCGGEAGSTRHMPGAYGEIARVLQGARRRQVRIVLLAGAGFAIAAALLLLLGGAVALALGARPGVRPFVLVGAAVERCGARTRRLFAFSILYLAGLFGAVGVDALVRP